MSEQTLLTLSLLFQPAFKRSSKQEWPEYEELGKNIKDLETHCSDEGSVVWSEPYKKTRERGDGADEEVQA